VALLTVVQSPAPGLGPAVGGFFGAWFGWRLISAALVALGIVTLGGAWLVLRRRRRRAVSRARGRMLGGYLSLLRSRSFCGYMFGGASASTSSYACLTASPYLHAGVAGHTAAAAFAGTPSKPRQRESAELDCSPARRGSIKHRRCPLTRWLAPAFYRKAVDQTPEAGVNFLDHAEHARAEHKIQLGRGGRPAPHGTANTITPTMVVGDGAHVKQHAPALDFSISLHPGIVEDKLVFLEAGGTDQGSLALRQRPNLLELLFSGNPAGLSAVRVGDVELERHASGARGGPDHDLRGKRKRII
jgi:hypothetical protein